MTLRWMIDLIDFEVTHNPTNAWVMTLRTHQVRLYEGSIIGLQGMNAQADAQLERCWMTHDPYEGSVVG